MAKYPFCARCGELLYRIGDYVKPKDSCCHCFDKKIQKNGKLALFSLLYVNPDPKIVYMDFDFDMFHIYEKLSNDLQTDYNKRNQIINDFNKACENFLNDVIVKNPYFSQVIRNSVLEDNKRKEKERLKIEEERRQRNEDFKKKREAEKAYEATHPKPKCPTCGSTNVEKISTANRMVSVGMLGLASDKIGKQFCCKNCGYKW